MSDAALPVTDPRPGHPLPGALPAAAPARLRSPRFGATRTITALMLREMGSTYGRSPGGYLWAILEPLGTIMIMTVAFSLFFRDPPLGSSFILFYAAGFLPYDFYNGLSNKTLSALRYSRSLLAYPRVTWIDVMLARLLLNMLTDLMVICIVFTVILTVAVTHSVLDIWPILLSLIMAALIGFGEGLINCLLVGIFPLWRVLWGIITRPLFIASGVLYIYEDMPGVVQDILWWNPLLHITGLARTGFYPTYDAAFVSLPYCFGIGLTLVAFGLVFLRAWYKLVLEA
jgi:capsular polysaccharide transport system permease protein